MKISLFNEKITFEKNTVTVDENANHKNEWSEYFTCHVYADTSGAKGEKESAGITVTESGLIFTLRFCKHGG
ncbi:MAG: phage head closure protein [Clostridia bacterium]|nr:phage head closure protein [Clostridia bacterium]